MNATWCLVFVFIINDKANKPSARLSPNDTYAPLRFVRFNRFVYRKVLSIEVAVSHRNERTSSILDHVAGYERPAVIAPIRPRCFFLGSDSAETLNKTIPIRLKTGHVPRVTMQDRIRALFGSVARREITVGTQSEDNCEVGRVSFCFMSSLCQTVS